MDTHAYKVKKKDSEGCRFRTEIGKEGGREEEIGAKRREDEGGKGERERGKDTYISERERQTVEV